MSREQFYLERLYLSVGPAHKDKILVESDDGTIRDLGAEFRTTETVSRTITQLKSTGAICLQQGHTIQLSNGSELTEIAERN